MVHFNIPEELLERVERTRRRYGFGTRSEFFRFVMLWYLESHKLKPGEQPVHLEPFDYLYAKRPGLFKPGAQEGA